MAKVEKKTGTAAAPAKKENKGSTGMALSKKMETALNAQIVAETYSAYMYWSMGAWLEEAGYLGGANWMSIQAREEMTHAAKFYRFILERGGQVRLGAIEAPPAKWASPVAVFKAAYEHEQKVTAMIHNLTSLARGESDYAAEIFLQWFVTEQVEEEASASEIVRKFELAGGDKGPGLYIIDKELAARTLSPATLAMLGA